MSNKSFRAKLNVTVPRPTVPKTLFYVAVIAVCVLTLSYNTLQMVDLFYVQVISWEIREQSSVYDRDECHRGSWGLILGGMWLRFQGWRLTFFAGGPPGPRFWKSGGAGQNLGAHLITLVSLWVDIIKPTRLSLKKGVEGGGGISVYPIRKN